MSTIILCRTCELELCLPEDQDIVGCPACGTRNARPQADADTQEMLRRATRQRLRCDFVHAESSYQYVLRESPEEHEALWGITLCRYGVEYVEDAKTGRRLPVVHAVRRRPMATDPDFRQACELAPETVRMQYEQEAAYIDNAMAEILRLAQECPPYDIFLCHKTTRPGTSELTADYTRAFSLYHKLDKMGYRVFFAPEELSTAAGASYEAGIYHALSTSRVMLVICSDAEYQNSPWVRSEWQRFLEMSYEAGADKRLIPLLYDSFPPRRMPVDFRQLQAISMGELDATEVLIGNLRRYLADSSEAEPVPAPSVKAVPVPAPVVQAEKPAFTPESEFRTTLVGGGVAVTGYNGKYARVVIPPEIGGMKVVRIAKGAFSYRHGVAEVLLPEGVRAIEENSFSACADLTKVHLPEGLRSIGENAFDECDRLQALSIPGSVEVIGSRAFADCRDLQRLELHAGLKAIGDWAFENCRKLESLMLPAGLRSIGVGAFSSCYALRQVSLPEGVESLGWCAFSDCLHLESVQLPASLTKIEDNPFQNSTKLTRIDVAYGNPVLQIKEDALISHGCKLVCYPAGLPARSYAIPAGVTSIGARAFCGCKALVTLEIPSAVAIIGLAAFANCPNLKLPLMVKLRFLTSKIFG